MAFPPRTRETTPDVENSAPEKHSVKENKKCDILEDESLNDEKIKQDLKNIVAVDIFGGITENGGIVCNIEALLAEYEQQRPNLYSNISTETPLFKAGKLNQSLAYSKECTEDYTNIREPNTDEDMVNQELTFLDKLSKDDSAKSPQDNASLCERKTDEDQVQVVNRYIGQRMDRDNVYVRVEKEYKKKKAGEISLKKGMKLKQKQAPTSDGMSYGWGKKYFFSPKKYGLFPVYNVSLV